MEKGSFGGWAIIENEGLPADLIKDWIMPPTAVRGTPNNDSYVLPTPDNQVVGSTSTNTPAKTTTPAGQAAAK